MEEQKLVFDKYKDDVRYTTTFVFVLFIVIFGVLGYWLAVAFAILGAAISFTSRWRLVIFPESRRFTLERYVCKQGYDLSMDLSHASHIEIDYYDSASEYETTRRYSAVFVTKDPDATFNFASETDINVLLAKVQELVSSVPLPVQLTDKMNRIKTSFESASETLRSFESER